VVIEVTELSRPGPVIYFRMCTHLESPQLSKSRPERGSHFSGMKWKTEMPVLGKGVDDSSPFTTRPSSGGIVRSEFRLLSILSLAVGLLLLLDHFGILSGVHRLWPVFPAFVGGGLLFLFRQRSRGDLILAGVSSYLLGVSILFFVCEFSSWTILARAWPVFVALLGVSSIFASIFAQRTRPILASSGVLLILVAGVFLLVVEVNPGLWPMSLVLFGLWSLLVASVRRRIERE
jgi:hypothetical protein